MKQIFKPEEVLEQIGGEEELLKDMINIFLEIYPDDLKSIENAIAGGDSEEIRKSVHRMKGSVSNFGKNSAFMASKQLEESFSSGDSSEINRLFDQLKMELNSLEKALREYKG